MRKRKTDYRPVYRAIAMISQCGVNMIVPICLMSALGLWLDKKLGTSYLMVVLFFVGAIAGFRNVYIVMKSFWKTPGEDNTEGFGERKQRDVGKDKRD
ncbi:MAG: AtpZ/AtpI family protein [Lachnospiraceae bacterium]|nr:AtpZ/AtpI family protein [Lachnospiraceae bacterium]